MSIGEPSVPGIGSPVLADHEILTRVIAGETGLFEILVRRYNQRLYRVIRSIVAEDAEAEDALQQSWIDAWKGLPAFEGRSALPTWLTRIAIREARRRRKRAASRPFATLDEGDRVLASAPGPEEDAMRVELRLVLEREIESLPESYRTIIILREVEGLDTAETAASLEVSPDTVKTRLSRARRMLRRRLSRHSGEALREAWLFPDPRCNRIVAAVLEAIAGSPNSRSPFPP